MIVVHEPGNKHKYIDLCIETFLSNVKNIIWRGEFTTSVSYSTTAKFLMI